MKTLRIVMMGLWGGFGSHLHAQSQEPRQEKIDRFLDERQKNPALYQSPPVTHMAPNFNMIRYAALAEAYDITILPSDDAGNVIKQGAYEEKLEIEGYTVAPHLAMSLKSVGLGFSIEQGEKSATYTMDSRSGGSAYHLLQRSTIAASGLGFNLSFVPFPKAFKKARMIVLLGGKTLNVRHRLSMPKTSQSDSVSLDAKDYTSLRYPIQRYAAGFNVDIQLLKAFRLVPWIDFTYTDTRDAAQAYSESQYGSYARDHYENDLRLFWLDYPKLRYGLDLGVHIGSFEIRIGGLLGSIAKLNASPEFIQDDSITLSFSWDQKGG